MNLGGKALFFCEDHSPPIEIKLLVLDFDESSRLKERQMGHGRSRSRRQQPSFKFLHLCALRLASSRSAVSHEPRPIQLELVFAGGTCFDMGRSCNWVEQLSAGPRGMAADLMLES